MLDYVVRLTHHPLDAAKGIDSLRGVGFDDRAVLDICQVAAYYNYVNRLAEGLGVALEPYWEEEDMTITHEEFEQQVRDRRQLGESS